MKATVVGLQGELGSGKTFFVKALAKMMGVEECVVSPTFVIMKIYDIDPAKAGQVGFGFKKFIHIDAYRLDSEKELLDLGWEDLIREPENLVLVEWPERVERIMPPDSKRIHFKHAI